MLQSLKKKIALLAAVCLLAVSFGVPAPTVTAVGVPAEPEIIQRLLAFDSISFDPLAGEPAVPQSLDRRLYAPGKPGLYVVQWSGPVYEEQKQRLRSMGASFGDYLPDSAFVVRMTPETAAAAKDLSFVRYVGVYKPAYKIERALFQADGTLVRDLGGADRVSVAVTGFGDSESLSRELTATGARILNLGGRTAVVEVSLRELDRLAELNEVVSINTLKTFIPFNDRAAGVMKIPGLWQSGLYGEGQVVAVADTGLDTGRNDASMHQDFQGRIQNIFTWGRQNDASDPHGHGTHVAGSILGSGAKSGGQYKGMAPKAKLIFQSVMDSQGQLSGIPNDLTALFGQAYRAGARIHSDSWGSESQGAYDSTSADVDRFVWNNPDMAIVIAAGNSGYNKDDKSTVYNSVSTPGTAKNAITVGASENDRPDKGVHGDNINSVAVFSSRGNTADGRVKPDIMAPGTWVLSTRSSKAPDSSFWAPFNQDYAFMGGTSMATPLTAGAVALVREFYQTRFNLAPRASLVKATLINGSDDMGMGFPSRDQGWGRLNLRGSIQPGEGSQFNFENESTALTTGQAKEYSVVSRTGKAFRAALVWTDFPSNPSAGKTLVNDLDLQVVSPSGRIFNGNDFTSPYDNSADRVNNVEIIRIPEPENGTYTVRVKGHNVPQGPQRFALVYSGDAGDGKPNPPPQPPIDREAPKVDLTSPRTGAVVSGQIELSATASDNYGLARVEFLVDGRVVGADDEAPYSFAWDSTQIENGVHRISARAIDLNGNTSVSQISTILVRSQGSLPPSPPTTTGGQVGQTFTGSVAWYAPNRNFYLDVTRSGPINLKLSWDGEADLDLYLFDSAGRMVGRSNAGANPETISVIAASPGQYRVLVNSYSRGANFNLKTSYPVDWLRTVVDDPTGSISVSERAEFDFSVTAPGSINATLDWESSADLNLYLLDSSGRILTGSNGSLRPESLSMAIGHPGRYRILITASGGPASYRLRVVHPK